MSEALEEADAHIELPGENGRYANIPMHTIMQKPITKFFLIGK